MLPISVCIITKNAEKYLDKCLCSLRKYNWEIVVTDTGSTDSTLSIAEKYTDSIYHFEWIDDFSAARNFCISKASHDWILSVDSDEYLKNKQSHKELLTLLNSVFEHPESIGIIQIISPFQSISGASVHLETIGRFFHREYYSYTGSIHEQLSPLATHSVTYIMTPFSFFHEGYLNSDVLKKKVERNIILLEESLNKNPEDPYLYFQLGQSYFVMGIPEKAYLVFKQGLSFDIDPNLQYVQLMVVSYGYCMLTLKKYQEALSFEGIYEAFCYHADFLFLMGLIYMNNGLFSDAINQFLKATKVKDHAVQGINSYLSYYNIGVIYECLGQKKEALNYYNKCGNYQPAREGCNRLK